MNASHYCVCRGVVRTQDLMNRMCGAVLFFLLKLFLPKYVRRNIEKKYEENMRLMMKSAYEPDGMLMRRGQLNFRTLCGFLFCFRLYGM